MVAAVVKKKTPWLLALAALIAPGPAAAHPEVSPQLVNRYLSVMILGDRLEYFVTFLYGPLPAVGERKKMDLDGDGTIGPVELDQATAQWKARAAALARLSLDGQPLPLDGATASVQLGPDQSTGAAPVVVELYGSRPLPAGKHQVRLEPTWDPPRLGETELTLDLSPDWELVASRQGHGPEESRRRYRFEGPRPSVAADRSATFTLQPSSGPARKPTVFIAAAIAALAGLALFLELRRRQRRSGSRAA
jgi:hypothetical protein